MLPAQFNYRCVAYHVGSFLIFNFKSTDTSCSIRTVMLYLEVWASQDPKEVSILNHSKSFNNITKKNIKPNILTLHIRFIFKVNKIVFIIILYILILSYFNNEQKCQCHITLIYLQFTKFEYTVKKIH